MEGEIHTERGKAWGFSGHKILSNKGLKKPFLNRNPKHLVKHIFENFYH